MMAMNRKILVLLLLNALLWFGLHFAFLWGKVSNPWMAVWDSLSFSGPLAIILWILSLSISFYRPSWQKVGLLLVISASSAFLALSMYRFIHSLWPALNVSLSSFISNGETMVFVIAFFQLLSFLLFGGMILDDEERHQRDKRRIELEQLARDAELSGLRLQLQPHFLFNSLNSVYALLQDNPAMAGRMILLLSDFFRSIVNKAEKNLILLKEEIRIIRMYLDIESIRFEHRLHLHFSIDEDAELKEIPALLLQPIVENAVKHGVYGTQAAVDIHVSALISGAFLTVQVSNPYMQETPQGKGSGFGLDSVRRRLNLLYNRNDLLEIRKSQDVFTVIIKIPV